MLVPVLLVVIALLAFGGPALRRTLGKAARVCRPTSGLLAVAAMMAAAVLAVREDWPLAAVLLAVAAGFAIGARKRRTVPRAAPASAMSPREARAILGVPEGAPAETVEAAYRRLMRMAHPDQGGTPGLAAQLNAARAVLRAR